MNFIEIKYITIFYKMDKEDDSLMVAQSRAKIGPICYMALVTKIIGR